MFWKKKCKTCNGEIKSDWSFCAHCGIALKEVKPKDMFQEVDREFQQAEKMLEMKPSKLFFRPRTKGVSITITAGSTSPPKINVQTFGGQRLVHHEQKHYEKPVRIPTSTEEPEAKVQQTRNKQIITVNLPDVKSLEDIEIKQLDQSVEIKAFAGDKAYFKLIPIPSNAMVNNEFKDGVLKIEVVK